MLSLLPLLGAGCPSPCVGAGCGEDFSAALVGVLTTLSDLDDPPDSPRDTPLTIIGDTDQGPDWALLLADKVLIVGSPSGGAVYSFSDSSSGTLLTEEADGALEGSSSTGFGGALARPARAIGAADLLVGAYLADQSSISRQEGSVYRFSGLGDGFSGTLSTSEASLVVTGTEPVGRFGEVVAACGDMDGDGAEDWAAAGTWDSSNQPLSGLVALALSGELPDSGALSARELSGFWLGAHDGARAGAALSCRDDVTGDGVADLLIGAPFADESSLEASGAVYLVPGPPTTSGPLLSSTYRTLSGLTAESWLGWSIATGDLSADGVPEIVVGAPGAVGGAGEVLIWDGAAFAAGDDRPLIRIRGEQPGDGLGRAVQLVDLDGDGDDDLVVGAPRYNPLTDDLSAFFSGALYIFAGAPGYRGWLPLRDAADAEVTLTLAQQYLQTGQAIVAGDFNGDGDPDLGLLHSTAPE